MDRYSELCIDLPLEILIPSTPVSQQGSPRGKKAWQQKIQDDVKNMEPEGCHSHTGDVSVIIYYFSPERMQGDIDNIVKPILDAMCSRVYVDDRQVISVFVKKFEPGKLVDIIDPSDTLTRAINHDRPVVYIGVDLARG